MGCNYFPNNQDFLPKLIRQKYKRKCQTRIFLLYATIMFVMYYLANWIWLWTMLVEKCSKKPSVPSEKRITKTRELWTNKWCHNALCIEFLMIYGIINLHNHMNFFRYLDVFYNPRWCFISINSVDTRYLNSLHKKTFSNQWLYFLVTLYCKC